MTLEDYQRIAAMSESDRIDALSVQADWEEYQFFVKCQNARRIDKAETQVLRQ